MKDPKDLLLSSYDYPLDPERIAQEPLTPRHAARLMIVPGVREPISLTRHAQVWDLQRELNAGDLLIVNDTRVLRARLKIRRPGGGLAELFVLEPCGLGHWLCLARPAKRLKPGDQVWIESWDQEPIPLTVVGHDQATGGRVMEFPLEFATVESMEKLLDRYGDVPLPPYIHRHDPSDVERYQTCYATNPGAVAAPTAGLHLSHELLSAIQAKGVQRASLTLHVGLGTFRPLEHEDLSNLQLHQEWVEVPSEVVEAVEDCRSRGGRIFAVGTTSVRALEGAAIAGGGKLKPFSGPVDLVIQPGFRFAVVNGLLTNFHLPKSSLLLLVSALVGRERLLELYKHANDYDYRYFSYGDAMWIPPQAVLPAARSEF